MKYFFGRVFSILIVSGGWAFAAARTLLEVIGYSSVPEDATVVKGLFNRLLQWIFSLPVWMPWTFALAATAVLMWVSWPRNALLPNVGLKVSDASPYPSIAAQMRFAKGQFSRANRHLEGRFERTSIADLDAARHKFRATEVSLQKQGFRTPWLDYEADPVRYIRTNLEFVEKVEPLISAKHIPEAKRQAELIVEGLPNAFIDKNRLR